MAGSSLNSWRMLLSAQRFFVAFVAGMFSLLLTASPGHAQFTDCVDPPFIEALAGNGATVPGGSFTCVEAYRRAFNADNGPREIRVVHDASADWAFSPGLVDAVRRGVDASIDTLPQLGRFSAFNTTIFIYDGSGPRGNLAPLESNTPARASQLANPAGQPIDECVIIVYALSVNGLNIPHIVAHEIFHCIQNASFPNVNIGPAARWWREGSAEWFAALAVPWPGREAAILERFETNVKDGRAIDQMAHAAGAFFYWLAAKEGATGVMDFCRKMPVATGAAAQQAAMRNALDQDGWQNFAEAYMDQFVRSPSGAAVTPDDGQEWHFNRSRERRISLQPFVIKRGHINIDCGKWESEKDNADVKYGVRDASSPGGWKKFENEIDTERDPERYRFAALISDTSDKEVQLKLTRDRSCEPCNDTRKLDKCLFGVWEQTSGGAAEMIRNNPPPGLNIDALPSDPGALVFQDDGLYVAAPLTNSLVAHSYDADGDRTDYSGYGQASGLGRWSAEGGQLNICQDSGGLTGSLTATTDDGSFTLPLSMPPGSISMQYSCSEGTMRTTHDVGYTTPIVTDYSKVEPPPEEE